MDGKIAFEYISGAKKYDKTKAYELARRGAREGIVLLENRGHTLPLQKGAHAAFFGRMQKHYLASGTGSGGRVQSEYNTNIFDSLLENGIELDTEAEAFYADFVASHPYQVGNGWTNPSSQEEPALEDEFVSHLAQRNETALFVITRISGEDGDLPDGRGGYMLTETELKTLAQLRGSFARVAVILNVSGIMDMTELKAASPDAVMIVWHGGMEGGRAAADVICGLESPSGRLPDTIAAGRESYPAYENFYGENRLFYREDIYVGYRYFQTFAPEKVIYPFGYGLSYTDFAISYAEHSVSSGVFSVRVLVVNNGSVPGREVVQCYVEAPCGRLGKPALSLCAYKKTGELLPGGSELVTLTFGEYDFASFDDINNAYILEKGEYVFRIGKNVRDNSASFAVTLAEDKVIKRVESALKPVIPFERLVNRGSGAEYEPVPLRVHAAEPIPETLPAIEKDGKTLFDVYEGRITLDEFVRRFSDADLVNIVRGEGMSSPKVTPGTGAAFGGVTPSLSALGIPVMCCTDGPSGVRMVSDAKCVGYPDATCIAAAWDDALAEDMYEFCGQELATHCVDILLGPGTNIHRDPICGRNFEYFSEDPLLAGKCAAAICRGLSRAGVSGAVKHFSANNREYNRHGMDAVVSERALREIYTRPFEICVRESDVRSVMTSYNPINGRWSASDYDLTVRLLRNDFGFDGFVMTDWWARVGGTETGGNVTALSEMVHARNDIYMVTPDAARREDDLASALEEGRLTRGELRACAYNICAFALQSLSYQALLNGYGKHDPASVCVGEPEISAAVNGGEAVIENPASRRVVIRVSYRSAVPGLAQTNIEALVNEKSAFALLVGNTNGGTEHDYREISLPAGENKFVFVSQNPLAEVSGVDIFPVG